MINSNVQAGMSEVRFIGELKAARDWWVERLSKGAVLNRHEVAEHITWINEEIARRTK